MTNKLYTVRDLVEQASKRGRPVTESYVRRLCRDRRIPGASKIASTWLVPEAMGERWLREWTGGE